METLPRTFNSFEPLNPTEERVLEMYSRGESYEVIQENLLIEYGLDFTNKKLGQKMGDIKRKMNCATQFQMGYLYGRREYTHEMKDKISKHYEALKKAKSESYEEGYQVGKQALEDFQIAKDYNKGLNAGLVFATVFWLCVFSILSHYIL